MIGSLPQPPLLSGISWRPVRKSDVDGIVVLPDVMFEVDGGFRGVASEILDRWTSDYCVVGNDSLVGINDQGEVIGSIWSYVPSMADTKWRAFQSDNYVHLAYRTSEVCDFVLQWWEAHCMQRFDAARLGSRAWEPFGLTESEALHMSRRSPRILHPPRSCRRGPVNRC